ncbi:TetR/AcrR family transcriptional regulator [Stagnihabitans tardus]|uniref:TetR family transcriptional regulator n=1 Tax=Stagnihabitans tardus TaxID=2699202 RepID=A0AAE5BVL7_9RHOB|nr:TetR family transcriptional regulator C-terminal domain-containing protein [Stagnihabitans tardus]NBZ89091.1 TetR family transcriptional regulator [Stagnihabitans tardus]
MPPKSTPPPDAASDSRKPAKARPDRRAEIAEAALTCLQRDGYASLTARKIAAEAGLSLGHITYHFASMDEVLAQAYRLASARLHAIGAAEMAGKASPMQRLEAFLHAGFTPQMLEPSHLRMRIDLWSAALSHPAIAATEAELYARYRAELETLLHATGAQGVTELADLIMAALDGLWLDHIRRGDEAACRNGLALCLRLVESALPLAPPKP